MHHNRQETQVGDAEPEKEVSPQDDVANGGTVECNCDQGDALVSCSSCGYIGASV